MEKARKSRKILVIDDDESILEALKIALESEGHEVFAFSEGTDVYEKTLTITPDIIFLDLLMSGKDGAEIARELKSSDSTKSIPIVMLSAHPNAEKAAKESGANHFLAKPFEYMDLLKVIDNP